MTASRSPFTAATFLYAVAAVAVGLAIQVYDGEYRPTPAGNAAVALLAIAIAAAAAGIELSRRESELKFKCCAATVSIIFIGLPAAQVIVLLAHWPDSADHPLLLPSFLAQIGFYRVFVISAVLTMAAGVMVGGFSRNSNRARVVLAWAGLFLFALASAWVLRGSTTPHSDIIPRIDVFLFQQQGARTLLHGHNPYAIDDYPDIYRSGTIDPETGLKRQAVYGPGLSDGHALAFGFPYLPMSLYMATFGYALTGDCRAAQATALVASAVLIYLARPGAISILAATLLLSTPRIFFILMNAWTEPLLVLWMAAAVYCALRHARLLPIALGLLLATKQYMLLTLPLTMLLVPRWRDSIKVILLAIIVAGAVTLPAALWNWHKFYFSVVSVQQYAPFRWDALSFLTWHAFGNGEPSARAMIAAPAVAVALTLGLSLWRAPRSAAGFAGSVGLVYLSLFAFSKQAFANYYFFVIGAFCCAVAASGAATGPKGIVRAIPPELRH